VPNQALKHGRKQPGSHLQATHRIMMPVAGPGAATTTKGTQHDHALLVHAKFQRPTRNFGSTQVAACSLDDEGKP
jgi:hypothetical protein